MKKIILNIFLLAFLIIFLLSAYKIGKYFFEENKNSSINNELIEKAVSKVPSHVEENSEVVEDNNLLPISIDFDYLKKRNRDIVGWIYSEDTPINYPVLQSKDNDYYLHRLVDGTYNPSGSIFMDYKNKSDLSDTITTIYGHNMRSSSMFGTFEKYKDQNYYEDHKIMYYFTEKTEYTIELFSHITVSSDSYIYNLKKMDQKELDRLIKKSNFKSDVTVTEDDKIIMLSTCSYEYEQARYILLGVLREIVY